MPTAWKTLSVIVCLALAGCAAPTAAPTPTPLAIVAAPSATPAASTATLPAITPAPTTTAPAATPAANLTLTAGQWNSLFYDLRLGQVVLVNGGPDAGKPDADPLELWTWDGAQWTLLSADPAGPPWRNFAGVAYDTTRQVLVVHGGVQARGAWLADTWEWDGTAWTDVSQPGPGAREGAEMAYDAARGQVVLFGGATNGAGLAGDTWAWDGHTWTQVSTAGPPPQFPNAMVYDAARQVVLLFGGHYVSESTFRQYGDLWAWDGAAWTLQPPTGPAPGYRIISRLVYDPVEARVVVFGGGAEEFLSDMWAWDGAQWAQIATGGAPARSGLGGAYDAARGVVVAFGGVTRPGGPAVTETWEWDRQTWQCRQGCP